MSDESKKVSWKGPTIQQIAAAAGVGPATVDRVLNDRSGVSERTRSRVVDALERLSRARADGGTERLDVRLFCDSGEGFNGAMAAAEAAVNGSAADAVVRGRYVATSRLEPLSFARRIVEEGRRAGGVVLVVREHSAFIGAVRELRDAGVPVICLTTDLPGSGRDTYVGNDQVAAGSVAAQLIGVALRARHERILLVTSVPFRSQQEREMGFRRVLRAEFPQLAIEERIVSDDVPEHAREQVAGYIETHGPPAAVYNVAGGNRGVARALEDHGRADGTIFVGHELTEHARALLESGAMDYVISHDFAGELATAVRCVRAARAGALDEPAPSPILVHTRYNCGP